jgi:valyl-tRNA synthetase
MLKGVVDFASEIVKLEKKKGKLMPALTSLRNKMALPAYGDKTPEKVKVANNEKLANYEKQAVDLDSAIEGFKKLC